VVRYAQHQQVVAIAPVPAAPVAPVVVEPGGNAAGLRASDGVTIDLTGEQATLHDATPAPSPDAGLAQPVVERNDYAQLGDQVSEVLRAADAVAEGLRSRAETDVAELRSRTELELANRARALDAQAEAGREEAVRLLRTAKEQANAMVADASAKAERILAAASARAEQHAGQAEIEARRHAERLVRFERDVHTRLLAARADVDDAIELLAGSEDRPVLDLTDDEARIRIGQIDGGDPALEEDGSAPRRRARTVPPEDAIDPLSDMVRSAVGRAVEASTRTS
jgi:hypothetical protein